MTNLDHSDDLAGGPDKSAVVSRIDTLSARYESYCQERDLPRMSADELLAEVQGGAVGQKADEVFLMGFIEQWDEALATDL